MLPDVSDLVQAFLIPAAGAGFLGSGEIHSDEQLRRMLDGFRLELRAQFEIDEERQAISRAKLETIAAEWAPRVENATIGGQIADMIAAGIVAPVELLAMEREQERALLAKIQSEVIAASERDRRSLRPYVLGWVEDGRSLADENIAGIEKVLVRARQVEADFRSAQISAYIRLPEDESSVAFEEQMTVARRMMAKYRNALRELAK